MRKLRGKLLSTMARYVYNISRVISIIKKISPQRKDIQVLLSSIHRNPLDVRNRSNIYIKMREELFYAG